MESPARKNTTDNILIEKSKNSDNSSMRDHIESASYAFMTFLNTTYQISVIYEVGKNTNNRREKRVKMSTLLILFYSLHLYHLRPIV